ncbi:MAG: enoyl-CoA hydratase-related protein [Pseudomonadota bacterium]|nr:enoyl-CoA hydratase-related protein [Pseudomonadota bacterium]
MEYKVIELETRDQISTITLNRPDRLNAWTMRMHAEYRAALKAADEDANVRAIIVTGNGKGFCAGADSLALEAVKKKGYGSAEKDELVWPGAGISEDFRASFAYHYGLSKPLVAAINGPAAGVGLVIACYADIRFSVPGVKFTTSHGRLNFPAEYGLSWVLPRIIGLGKANDLLLTSRIFLSDEAYKLGLVNYLVPRSELMNRTRAYVQNMITTVSPRSLQETRHQVYKDLHRNIASSVEESERLIVDMSKDQDFKEGLDAYLEKRNPQWKGK